MIEMMSVGCPAKKQCHVGKKWEFVGRKLDYNVGYNLGFFKTWSLVAEC
jgi:hypothetical protein